jgi:hypothetical protein
MMPAMPVTPFHLGPAIVVKAVCPRWISLGVFAAVQIAIDVESVANILLGRYPVHGVAHTVPGSLLVAALVLVPARALLGPLYGRLARVHGVPPWARAELGAVSWTAALGGAVFGALSHVLLDAVIHADQAPLWPWVDGNPWLVPGAFVPMHLACAVAGLAGLVLWPALAARRAGSP